MIFIVILAFKMLLVCTTWKLASVKKTLKSFNQKLCLNSDNVRDLGPKSHNATAAIKHPDYTGWGNIVVTNSEENKYSGSIMVKAFCFAFCYVMLKDDASSIL